MIQIFFVFIYIVFIWIFFLALRFKLSYLHLILFFLTFHFVGVYNNAVGKGNFYPVYLIALALFLFVFGLFIYRLLNKESCDKYNKFRYFTKFPKLDFYLLVVFFLIILFFIIYHYITIGIPLLSEYVEIERFDFSRSGLFGIPSRIMLFGPFFLIFLIAAYSQVVANRNLKIKTFLFLTYLVAIVSSILTGLRSALIMILVVIVIANTYVPRWKIKEKISLKKLILFAILALIFVFLIAWVYEYHKGAELNVVEIVSDRIFYMSGETFYFIVDELIPFYGFGHGSYTFLDIKYVSSLVHLFPNILYNTNQFISAKMSDLDPTMGFVSPVTPNIFGYFYLEFATIGLIIFSLLLGIFCGWLYFLPCKQKNILFRSVLLYIQLGVFTIITRGDLIYDLANRAFALFFLLFFLLAINIILKAPLKETSLFKLINKGN